MAAHGAVRPAREDAETAQKEREKMRIEEFAEKIRGAMEKELGDGYRIECREVRKCLQITYASLLQNLQILSGLL